MGIINSNMCSLQAKLVPRSAIKEGGKRVGSMGPSQVGTALLPVLAAAGWNEHHYHSYMSTPGKS